MKRILIAGTHSGCGKTSVVCAVLQAFINRKISVTAFKCGPDYIDPMFHSRVTGVPAYNLDRRFCDKNTVNYLLQTYGRDFAVIEGVMGFYDGADENSSTCAVSFDTGTPAVIVVDCKGMSQSAGALIQGFLNYRQNKIAGFIFNRLPESIIPQTKELCRELGTEYLGRLPYSKEYKIESRHLGLVAADEISDLKNKLLLLADSAEKNILLDRIYEIAGQAEKINIKMRSISAVSDKKIKIGIAYDKAFCFYYEESFELLRKLGCELVFFSPMYDKQLPNGICGLWLGGGYPEIFAKQLSENTEMLKEIYSAISGGLPVIAECGGYLYLSREIEDINGISYKAAGFFDGKAYRTNKLNRFGYADLTANSDNLLCQKGDTLKSHEYHYWDCTNLGKDFTAARKNGVSDLCVHCNDTIYAGFPHLYLWANVNSAGRFVKKCLEYRNGKNK